MKQHRLLSAAFAVMVANLLLKLTGLLRTMALASTYGIGVEADAFNVAFTVPSIALAMIGASVASSFIPMYHRVETDKRRFVSNVLSCVSLIGVLFSVLFFIFPQALAYIFASQLEPETFNLAVPLIRVMVLGAMPILAADILRSYLQLKNSFFLALAASLPINIATIAGILISKPAGALIYMSWGSVLGNVLAVTLLFALCRREEFYYTPVLAPRAPEFRGLLVILSPVILATAVAEINQIVDRNFASSLPTGAFSALDFANRTTSFINSIVGVSLVTALFPRLSALATSGDLESMKKQIMGVVRRLVPFMIPVTVGIVAMAQPCIRIFLERGEFTRADTLITAECLSMYALMLLPLSLNPLLVRGFYATQHTKTPAIISACTVAVNIALNFAFIGPLQHRGLALATAIAAFLNMILLALWLRRRLGPLGLAWREMAKVGAASLIMGAAAVAGNHFLPVMSGGTLQCLALTLGIILVCAALYAALLALMRAEIISEAAELIKNLKGRISKKAG